MQKISRRYASPPRFKLAAWVAGITACSLLLGAGGAAAAMRFDAKHKEVLFQGVKVGDVSIDGMRFGAARQRLMREFEAPLDRKVSVKVEDKNFDTTPRELGVTTNVMDVYRKAVSIPRSMSLLERVWYRVSGRSVERRFEVETQLDQKKVDAFIQHVGKQVDRPAKDSSLSLTGDGIKISEPVSGYAVDRKAAVETLKTLALSGKSSTELQGKTVRPAVTKENFKDILVLKVGENKLFHYRGEALQKVYDVATGEDKFPTPLGRFKIVNKRFQPTWVNPAKHPGGWGFDLPARIPSGPGNPLGTRAMDLNSPGIRIHGTYSPKSIGFNASHGCIRMRMPDVEELFEKVSVGTPVIIVRSGPNRPMPPQPASAKPEPLAESDGTNVPGVGAGPAPVAPPAAPPPPGQPLVPPGTAGHSPPLPPPA